MQLRVVYPRVLAGVPCTIVQCPGPHLITPSQWPGPDWPDCPGHPEEPGLPSEEPSLPSKEPSLLSEEPSVPSEEPSLTSEEPSLPSEEHCLRGWREPGNKTLQRGRIFLLVLFKKRVPDQEGRPAGQRQSRARAGKRFLVLFRIIEQDHESVQTS